MIAATTYCISEHDARSGHLLHGHCEADCKDRNSRQTLVFFTPAKSKSNSLARIGLGSNDCLPILQMPQLDSTKFSMKYGIKVMSLGIECQPTSRRMIRSHLNEKSVYNRLHAIL
jgi:hypothetical protein